MVFCKNMRVDLNNAINLHKLPESADLIFYLVIKQVEVSGDAAYSSGIDYVAGRTSRVSE